MEERGNEKEVKRVKHELHIIWDEKGIQVSGCILAEVLALGLLEKAKEIVIKANRPKIIPKAKGVFGRRIR